MLHEIITDSSSEDANVGEDRTIVINSFLSKLADRLYWATRELEALERISNPSAFTEDRMDDLEDEIDRLALAIFRTTTDFLNRSVRDK